MKLPLYILKIGGSVVTYKNRELLTVRQTLLEKIARSLAFARTKKPFHLILLHGSGAAGHHLAKRYALHAGTRNDKEKWHAAFLSQQANQKLNHIIARIFIKSGLPLTPCHTASVIVQKNGNIKNFQTNTITAALEKNCIPLLYGEMVFDTTLGMSVCSGDTIAAFLSQKYKAQKIFFASDIDGLFTRDPHRHKNAALIEHINIFDVKNQSELSSSHNVDVTGGLLGKIQSCLSLRQNTLKNIEIFNGFAPKNYSNIFLEKYFPHTTLSLKKKQRASKHAV